MGCKKHKKIPGSPRNFGGIHYSFARTFLKKPLARKYGKAVRKKGLRARVVNKDVYVDGKRTRNIPERPRNAKGQFMKIYW